MRQKFWIYKITNTVNNKIYIGQTCDIFKRKSSHKRCVDKDTYLTHSIQKYGWNNHKLDILFYSENVTIPTCNKIEEYFIRFYDSCYLYNKNGLNLTEGGMNGVSTKEQIDKMVNSKFYSWKRKHGKENLAIEVYDLFGYIILKHYGNVSELFKILKLEYNSKSSSLFTSHLRYDGIVFKKKWIIQWEGEDRVKLFFSRNKLWSQRAKNCNKMKITQAMGAAKVSIPVLDLYSGVYYNSISDISRSIGIDNKTFIYRMKHNSIYKNKYIA